MLIPGLPPAGSLNDKLKTRKDVAPAAPSEPLHEALAQPIERRRRDSDRFPERRRRRKQRLLTDEMVELAVEQASEERAEGELPDKGLLVDIEV